MEWILKRFQIFFLSLCRGMTDVQFLCFESPTLQSIYPPHSSLSFIYQYIKCKRSCRWLLHRSAPVSVSLSHYRWQGIVSVLHLTSFVIFDKFSLFFTTSRNTVNNLLLLLLHPENATTMRVTHVDWWIDGEKTPTNNLVLSNPWVHDGTRDQTINRRRSVEVNERKTKVYEKFQ